MPNSPDDELKSVDRSMSKRLLTLCIIQGAAVAVAASASTGSDHHHNNNHRYPHRNYTNEHGGTATTTEAHSHHYRHHRQSHMHEHSETTTTTTTEGMKNSSEYQAFYEASTTQTTTTLASAGIISWGMDGVRTMKPSKSRTLSASPHRIPYASSWEDPRTVPIK